MVREETRVIVVDPSSGGGDLVDALVEVGVTVLELWHPERAHLKVQRRGVASLMSSTLESDLCASAEFRPQHIIAGSEYGVLLAERLAATMGLPTNSPALGSARRNKSDMIESVANAGVPVGWSRSFERGEVLDVPSFSSGYIVKPVDSAGSDGVSFCVSHEEVVARAAELLESTNLFGMENTAALIQEALVGPQYIVNAVSKEGRHVLVDVFLYRIDHLDHRPVVRSAVSVAIENGISQSLAEYVFSCLDALGIHNGASHTEVRVTADGPRLIEVNSRVMGPVLPADVFRPTLGTSHALAYADVLAGKEIRRSPRPMTLGQVLLRCNSAGRIRSFPGFDSIRQLPGFRAIAKAPQIGDAVTTNNLVTNGTLGLVYFAGALEEVQESVSRLHVLEDEGGVFDVGA